MWPSTHEHKIIKNHRELVSSLRRGRSDEGERIFNEVRVLEDVKECIAPF